MRALTASEIAGNWATLLLPINPDESIAYDRLAAEIDALIGCGVDGIYSNGTAGEFYTQSEDEYDRVSALLAERGEAAGVPFQIGASHPCPQTSLARIRRAAALKPSAIQVILADWFPLTDDEAVDCLARMAEAAAPIGLVLYNPPHAKRVLRPETYARLKAEVPGLVGVKVADGDAAWYAAMRQHAAGLSVFVPGHHLATGVRQGAAGSYSNVACLSPAGAQRWYAMMHTDPEAALALEGRIRVFMDKRIVPFITRAGYANQAVDKLLAAIGGWADIGTRLRWPYRWIPEAEVLHLRPAARGLLPELFTG
jgi:dihydrodipicolinate synthase/N-acetylneuraminate lyase